MEPADWMAFLHNAPNCADATAVAVAAWLQDATVQS